MQTQRISYPSAILEWNCIGDKWRKHCRKGVNNEWEGNPEMRDICMCITDSIFSIEINTTL